MLELKLTVVTSHPPSCISRGAFLTFLWEKGRKLQQQHVRLAGEGDYQGGQQKEAASVPGGAHSGKYDLVRDVHRQGLTGGGLPISLTFISTVQYSIVTGNSVWRDYISRGTLRALLTCWTCGVTLTEVTAGSES